MTQPVEPPAPARAELEATVDEADESLLGLAAVAVGVLAALRAWSVANWLRGTTNQTGLQAGEVRNKVDAVDWATAAEALRQAQAEGAATALVQLSLDERWARVGGPTPVALDASKAEETISLVRANLLSRLIATTQMPVALQPGFVNQAVQWAESGLSSGVEELSSEAQLETALANGGSAIWHGERNACVVCTGFIGAVVSTRGEAFQSVGFDGKGGGVLSPPVHPHCRCQLVVVSGNVEPLALAYRREAVRQVLKGWRLESESNAARLRAAEALLAKNPTAPASVKTAAQRAVEAGKFKDGGMVP